jgi:hypothetical protein
LEPAVAIDAEEIAHRPNQGNQVHPPHVDGILPVGVALIDLVEDDEK